MDPTLQTDVAAALLRARIVQLTEVNDTLAFKVDLRGGTSDRFEDKFGVAFVALQGSAGWDRSNPPEFQTNRPNFIKSILET
jgi:hypothetical protein